MRPAHAWRFWLSREDAKVHPALGPVPNPQFVRMVPPSPENEDFGESERLRLFLVVKVVLGRELPQVLSMKMWADSSIEEVSSKWNMDEVSFQHLYSKYHLDPDCLIRSAVVTMPWFTSGFNNYLGDLHER